MLSYQKLDVYRCALELLALISEVVESMQRKKGGTLLADQLLRAGLSDVLNIAEGAGKRTAADQTKHFVIARASAMECGAVFDAALVMRLVDPATAARAAILVTRLVEMLTKMCRFADLVQP
jgi:four helix bundle protein